MRSMRKVCSVGTTLVSHCFIALQGTFRGFSGVFQSDFSDNPLIWKGLCFFATSD